MGSLGIALICLSYFACQPGFTLSEKSECSNCQIKSCFSNLNLSIERDEPTEVSAGLLLYQLYDFNEVQMQFSIQTLLKIIWVDPIINLDGLKLKSPLVLTEDMRKCFWKPDIVFYNSKESSEFTITVPNVVSKIMPGGYIYQYSRYSLVIGCELDFRDYPMDTQTCSFYIQLFSSRDNTATLNWMHESNNEKVRKIPSIAMHVLILNKLHQFSTEEVTPMTRKMIYTSGNTTALQCHFTFKRYTTSAFVNTYIPSFLVVCVAYVSFWLDVEAVPGRISLCVTAFLTIATQMISARNGLPSINYITAIDIWLFGCLILVFTSLVEFVIANSLSRRATRTKIKDLQNQIKKQECQIENVTESKPVPFMSFGGQKQRKNAPQTSKVSKWRNYGINDFLFEINLDSICRRMFPVLVITFTTFYFVFYLGHTNRL